MNNDNAGTPFTPTACSAAKIKQNIYEHGGCRIWLETEDGHRDLVADAYLDKEFSEALGEFVRRYMTKQPTYTLDEIKGWRKWAWSLMERKEITDSFPSSDDPQYGIEAWKSEQPNPKLTDEENGHV